MISDWVLCQLNIHIQIQGTVSLKLLGGISTPKMIYFVLEKELLDFSEMAPSDMKERLLEGNEKMHDRLHELTERRASTWP